MEQKDIQQYMEELASSTAKTTAYLVNNSNNKEHSNLIADLRKRDEEKSEVIHEISDIVKELRDEFRQHRKEDLEWKTTAMPVIEMGRNVQGFGKVSLYILGFFASVMGAIYGIIELIKHKTQ